EVEPTTVISNSKSEPLSRVLQTHLHLGLNGRAWRDSGRFQGRSTSKEVAPWSWKNSSRIVISGLGNFGQSFLCMGRSETKIDPRRKTYRYPARKMLVVDIQGTPVKAYTNSRRKEREVVSGPKLTPRKMVSKKLVTDWDYDVISIGYPG